MTRPIPGEGRSPQRPRDGRAVTGPRVAEPPVLDLSSLSICPSESRQVGLTTKHAEVDCYVLLIHPLVFGSGRRLFADGGPLSVLRLLDSKTSTKSVIVATYEPAEPPRGDLSTFD
jgi:hypothetical protein